MGKTLEQLQAEAKAAQEAVAQAEHECREKARLADEAIRKCQQEAAAKAVNERDRKLRDRAVAALEPIYIVLQAHGLDCAFDRNVPVLRISFADYEDHHDLRVRVESERSRSGGRRWTHDTGRFAVVVGIGSRQYKSVRFPEKNDGTHSVNKIVAEIKQRMAAILLADKRAKETLTQAQAAELLAKKVRKDNGFAADDTSVVASAVEYRTYSVGPRGEYRTQPAPAGRVYLLLGTRGYTPEQAAIVLKALKAAAAIEPKAAKEAA